MQYVKKLGPVLSDALLYVSGYSAAVQKSDEMTGEQQTGRCTWEGEGRS